jgi:hypothetical protein
VGVVHVFGDLVLSEVWAVLLVLFVAVVSLGFAVDFFFSRVTLFHFIERAWALSYVGVWF